MLHIQTKKNTCKALYVLLFEQCLSVFNMKEVHEKPKVTL